jgi:transcriptional regulator with XRE-family HTH domain
MTIGERIKRIREFRGLTQKDVGLALGYQENTAKVRIAQYEAGSRVPKKETAIEIANILNINYVAIYDDNLSSAEQIMQTLFWLEEEILNTFHLFKLNPKPQKEIVTSVEYNGLFTDDYYYPTSKPPIAIAFSYNLINDFLAEWFTRIKELEKNIISREEYFEWKINWPYSCDENGKFEPTIKWRKDKK